MPLKIYSQVETPHRSEFQIKLPGSLRHLSLHFLGTIDCQEFVNVNFEALGLPWIFGKNAVQDSRRSCRFGPLPLDTLSGFWGIMGCQE
jgi:hypothetical protein